MPESDFDGRMMARALALAAKGAGRASPNPLVGAVVVSGGRVVGEGFHRAYGGLHAEAEAVAAAAAAAPDAVPGATLYCNLEPCCYRSPEKHQPPCTELIIRHKFSRVVIANRDPNPRVDGEGVRTLRAAGIRVDEGVLSEKGEALNEAFFHSVRSGFPFVHLKAAQSLDGRVAAVGGDSKWITDERARREVHRLRATHDAVLVGSATVRADDPELTVRLCRGRNPLRVVLSSRLDIPPAAKLLRGGAARGLVVFRAESDSGDLAAAVVDRREAALSALGARVFVVPQSAGGGLDLRAVLETLHALSVRSVLVEGGAEVFTTFVRENLYQKISFFVAPIVVGDGLGVFGNLGVGQISAAPRLVRVRYSRIGDQLRVSGYRKTASGGLDVHGHR